MTEQVAAPDDDAIVLNDTDEEQEEGVVNRILADFVPSLHNRLLQFARRVISQKRRRFEYQGLDLDLAYITDRIIAVGYPSEGWEKAIRNTMGHTVEFLKRRHGEGKVKVFNLRGGFLYDPKKFNNDVIYFDMKDHHPPSLELMAPFCREAREWLDADVENVIAVHCKAGKGRTGVMICAYLIYSNFYPNPRQVLDYYSIVRTTNNKGVTIPSQRRYIYYYNFLRERKLNYFPLRQELVAIYLERPPQTNGLLGTSKIKVKVSNGSTTLFTSEVLHIDRDNYQKEQRSWLRMHESNYFWAAGTKFLSKRAYSFLPTKRVFVEGDVRVDLINEDRMVRDRKIGHVWFNTMFTCRGMGGQEFIYGDKQWPYESRNHTSIGYKGEAKDRPEDLFVPNVKTHWNIRKPTYWDDKKELDAVKEIYEKHDIAPPREKIVDHLFDAHRNGYVRDDWNDRKNKFQHTGDAYNQYGRLDPLTPVGGPFQIPFKPNEHVLTFPVYEIDRALKNKKLNNGMKLHVVLRCIDSKDSVQSELAREACNTTHENTERIGLQTTIQTTAQYPVEPPAPNARGAEKKMPPSIRYAKDGGYNGTAHKNLTDEHYKNEPFAEDPRWCRYYYRQRADSESKWPSLRHTCHLTEKTFKYDMPDDDDDEQAPEAPGPSDNQPPADPKPEDKSDDKKSEDKKSEGKGSDRADQQNPPAPEPENPAPEAPEAPENPPAAPESAPEAPEPENKPSEGDLDQILLPEQLILDDFPSYEKALPKGDPLLAGLRENYEKSRAAHVSLVETYRKQGASEDEIQSMMMSPDAEFEPLEDPNFWTRGGVKFGPKDSGEFSFKKVKQPPTPEDNEEPDHLSAIITQMYVRDRDEAKRKYTEYEFKRNGKKFKLDREAAEAKQRKYSEGPGLFKNYFKFETVRLKKEKSKMKREKQDHGLFTSNKYQEGPSTITEPQSLSSYVLTARWSEKLKGSTIQQWTKYRE